MNNSNTRVIIVAERIQDHSAANNDDRTLEYLNDTYFNGLINGLEVAQFSWLHISHPKELMKRNDLTEHDVVLSLWSGRESRNRRALAPAICETLAIPYVGMDAYTATVCQDKVLAKHFCAMAGLPTPKHVIVPQYRMPADFSPLRFPCVVKPAFEGGSMGISDSCIVHNAKEALALSLEMRDVWKQPILVEEFVQGREVSICLYGKDEEYTIGATEIVVKDDPDYFDTHLNGYDLKKAHNRPRSIQQCPIQDYQSYINNCRNLFKSLGKVDFMRIDGKLNDKGFTVLELTPDSHLGPTASFARSLTTKHHSYSDMLCDLIALAK
ncbi:MAG: hypothetical protein COB46_08165 [Rhodospirillaceae bacterium]|nr:MAG: hypothetical protein COB46_08165 [Rhodospirillaceae bacterium]